MEARDIAASGPAGIPRRLEAPSPRYGEKAIVALLGACAILSVLTTTAIVISLIGPTIGFFGDRPDSRLPLRHRLDAAVRARRASACWRSSSARSTSPCGECCSRSRSGSGLRSTSASTPVPASARWSSPASRCWPASRPWRSASSRSASSLPDLIQKLAGIPRRRRESFIALSAGVGIGLMVVPIIASISEDAMRGGPAGPARGRLRDGRDQDARSRPGWCSRRRCPASSPRSCWRSRAPSARR